jgi:hypothetical protein
MGSSLQIVLARKVMMEIESLSWSEQWFRMDYKKIANAI